MTRLPRRSPLFLAAFIGSKKESPVPWYVNVVLVILVIGGFWKALSY